MISVLQVKDQRAWGRGYVWIDEGARGWRVWESGTGMRGSFLICCNYGLCAGICSKVCSSVAFPDVITCLKFVQFPCSSDLELGAALQLAVGTAQGSVWVLDAAMNSTAPAKPLNARYCAPYQLECG